MFESLTVRESARKSCLEVEYLKCLYVKAFSLRPKQFGKLLELFILHSDFSLPKLECSQWTHQKVVRSFLPSLSA